MILSPIDVSLLTDMEQKRINEYLNPNSWYRYTQQSRNVFQQRKADYQFLVKKSGDNLKPELEKIVANKLESLKGCAYSPPTQKQKECAYSPISIMGICTLSTNRKCSVTGVDISMQRKESFLLSETGLKHLYENDNSTFKKIKNRFLSKKWKRAKLDKQIFQIYKAIRTRSSYLNSKMKREQLILQK